MPNGANRVAERRVRIQLAICLSVAYHKSQLVLDPLAVLSLQKIAHVTSMVHKHVVYNVQHAFSSYIRGMYIAI